jgi:hypothetical protein
MNKALLSFSVVLLLLAGCVNSVTKDIVVETGTDPRISFAGYSTYSWLGSASIVYDPEGQWEPPQFDADAEIKFLIDRELRKAGMTEAAANPDMIVAFAAGIDMSLMEIKIDPESNLSKLENVPMGALTVILIDANTGLATWGGIATGEIQQSPDQEIVRQRLDFAVSSMFKEFHR